MNHTPQRKKLSKMELMLCDYCCDNSGTVKELTKTGGCTCDICGWSCQCSGDSGKQYVNRIQISLIPDDGWDYLHSKNEDSSKPLIWEEFYS